MILVECIGLEGQQYEQCAAYYKVVYKNNMPAATKCLDDNSDSVSTQLECSKLLGALCQGAPKPPSQARIRPVMPDLYNKYIQPRCMRVSLFTSSAREVVGQNT